MEAAPEIANSGMESSKAENSKSTSPSRYFIALGSNVGNRFEMIEQACREMDDANVRVLRTSGLWETQAMYVEDQPSFLNGVCEVCKLPRTRNDAYI